MNEELNIPESTKIERRRVDLVRQWKRLSLEDEEVRGEAPPAARYIGVYRIEKRLGKGGMGKVYLAHDDRLGRRVAIKQIRGDKARGVKPRARLQREARAVARLNHPAIAQVHDVVYDDEGYSIVMEYVEGSNVAQLLAGGKLDGGLAINVAIQVAQGLAAAHNLGMVHRDLKAENVMVTPAGGTHPGRAKILDFGLVKKISPDGNRDSLTERGLLLGTVGSMSPEQASGRAVDARSDLFSFGILLYEMFTGYSPFRRERWLDSLEAVKVERQASLRAVRPELPVELSNLTDWLLQKDPARRPQNTRQVVDVLASIAATTQIGALRSPRAALRAEPWSQAESTTDSFAQAVGATPISPTPAPSKMPPWVDRLARLNPTFTSIAFLALATLGLIAWKAGSSGSTHVLVVEPKLRTLEQVEVYDTVAEGVRGSMVDALERLERVVPVAAEPGEVTLVGGLAENVTSYARSIGAREALVAELLCADQLCRVSFRRIRASDNMTLSLDEVSLSVHGRVSEAELEKVTALIRDKLYAGYRFVP